MLWPLGCALLALGCLLAWAIGNPAELGWSPRGWASSPWTLWTASLLHVSPAHLLGNLAALAAIAGLGVTLQAGRTSAVALLLAWPTGTLALGLWPQVGYTVGMSGTLCAMLAILTVHTATDAGLRPMAYILFASLALKLLAEHAWSQPVGFDPAWGFNVVYAAHLAGAVAGATAAILAWAVAHRR